jgi:hypothetical protein
MKATRILTGLLIGLMVSLHAGMAMAQAPTGKGGGGDAGIKFEGTVEVTRWSAAAESMSAPRRN